MQADVAVLGGGSWGTILAHLAAHNGQRTTLYMRSPEACEVLNTTHTNPRYLGDSALHPGITATSDLELAVRGTPVVIFCVPSKASRAVARSAGAFITGDQVVLSATKGLEPESFHTVTALLRAETCALKLGALSGPNLAKEIMRGQPSATVVASHYREVIERATQALHSELFRIYGQDDLRGVELAGALKNVIAIACGAAAGLGFGHNVRALLVTRGLAEIQRLGVKLGADPLTFSGLAGVGDLMVTCSSELSRNFRVGRGIAQGKTLDEVVEELGEVAEGVNTTRVALALAAREGVQLPITEAVGALLDGEVQAQEILGDLMGRAARYEIDFDYTAEVG
ncbi:MAG: NAD(P)-dependent glycerol-3-phosphate dehydrogenase [Planctomycetes bacterium]|nr:NAD(P)-dependent glycerol-3-phosphate dehydrogenase [Planctomycetota bacterium]